MESIRNLLMNKDTLDVVIEKSGLNKDQTLMPWGDGFALTDKVGNITNYLNIDSNGRLLIQDKNFSASGQVDSVVEGQYQLYENSNLIGTLFTNPDIHGELTGFLNFDFNEGIDAIDSLINVGSESLDPLSVIIDKLNLL